jgi:hypothetical protein
VVPVAGTLQRVKKIFGSSNVKKKGREPTKVYISRDKVIGMIKINALFLLFLCFTNLGPLSRSIKAIKTRREVDRMKHLA